MSTTGPQLVAALQHANVSVNTSSISGQINSITVTNQGSGYLGAPFVGSNLKTPSQPHIVVPPNNHHWQIEHILPHMIWSKFYYQKECWRLWHWLSYSDGREDDGMHDVYNKTHRDFPTELEAKSVMVLEQFAQ